MLWLLVFVLASIFLGLLIMRCFCKGKNWSGKQSARGKTMIITGANSGIGKALAEEIAMRGADRVVLACRSRERAQKAMEELIQNGADPSILSVEIVDLMSFKSVVAFVDVVQKKFSSVDVLVCNAGVLQAEGVTEDGNERLLQANYLGHFLMVEMLRARVDLGRVVFVSSLVHKYCKVEDLTEELGSAEQYYRAKLAEVSYAKHLATEGMEAYSCNPGVVHTNILAGTWMAIFDRFLAPLLAFTMKTPAEGAQTPLMLCLAPSEQLQSGGYYSDCSLAATHPLLQDPVKVARLHAQSLEIVAP